MKLHFKNRSVKQFVTETQQQNKILFKNVFNNIGEIYDVSVFEMERSLKFNIQNNGFNLGSNSKY